MWRRKATVIGVLWLTAGCAAIPDARSDHQMASVAAQTNSEVKLEGCLLTGAAPGTFVLDVTSSGRSNQVIDVMSTRSGLTAHVGRRLAVRGQEQAAPSRSIHDGATLFTIRSLEVLEAGCPAPAFAR
jgi:hypothetical protein